MDGQIDYQDLQYRIRRERDERARELRCLGYHVRISAVRDDYGRVRYTLHAERKIEE